MFRQKKILIVISVLLSMVACSNEGPTEQDLKDEAYKQISLSSESNERLLNAGVSLKSVKPTGIENKGLEVISKSLCAYFSDGALILNDKDYFNKDVALNRYVEYFNSLPKFKSCSLTKVMVNSYPFSFLEFELEGTYIYANITYDDAYKIRSLSFLPFQQRVFISRTDLKARDGELLTTYVIGAGDGTASKGVVFNRSPYMSYGEFLFQASLALQEGLNYVVQANRGTHTSTGVFRWLDPVDNANDAEDTIKWIRKQSFSNGRVVSYGVSYDGFNALASTLNKPEGLVGVISCSSPANAATDSLSAGKHASLGLFTYVTERDVRTREEGNFLNLRPQHQVINRDDRERLDVLYAGGESEEWNLISEANDDKNHPYWTERSLYKQLEDIDLPIFHIAGLNQDQDGKDTILLYEYLEENSQYKEKNFLGLHPGGHGCGHLMGDSLFKKILNLAANEIPFEDIESSEARTRVANMSIQNYKHGEKYQPNMQEYSLGKDLFLEDASIVRDQDYSKISIGSEFSQSVKGDHILNGVPEIELDYIADLPDVSVHATFYVTNSLGELKGRIRSHATVLGEPGVKQSIRVRLPLSLMGLSEGDRVGVYFSSVGSYIFLRYPAFKDDVGLFKDGAGVQILASTRLLLPLE